MRRYRDRLVEEMLERQKRIDESKDRLLVARIAVVLLMALIVVLLTIPLYAWIHPDEKRLDREKQWQEHRTNRSDQPTQSLEGHHGRHDVLNQENK